MLGTIKAFAILSTSLIVMAASSTAQAQSTNQDANSYLRGFLNNRPTVSPYLNLVNQSQNQTSNNSSVGLYQNLVRPQLEARQNDARTQAQVSQIQRQLNQTQRDLRSVQQNGAGAATGHPTRFMSYLNYYPGLNR